VAPESNTVWWCRVSGCLACGAMCLVDHTKIVSEYEAAEVVSLLGLSPNSGSHECLGVPTKALVAAIERYRCECALRPCWCWWCWCLWLKRIKWLKWLKWLKWFKMAQVAQVAQVLVVLVGAGGAGGGGAVDGVGCSVGCDGVGCGGCWWVLVVLVVLVFMIAVIAVLVVVALVVACGSCGSCGKLLMVVVAPPFCMVVIGLIAVMCISWVGGVDWVGVGRCELRMV
jgi:hypothetical protein